MKYNNEITFRYYSLGNAKRTLDFKLLIKEHFRCTRCHGQISFFVTIDPSLFSEVHPKYMANGCCISL